MFVDKTTLEQAVSSLFGTAGHLLKIWFVLKHMGLATNSSPVKIDTSNSTSSLERLFAFGDPNGRYYIPFAHTKRYSTMMHDASRSIVQTTIQRWASSGSVVTCDPTSYLDIKSDEDGKLLVSTARKYPLGLGLDESGFAINNGFRVQLPIHAFAVWYGRESFIPDNEEPSTYLVNLLLSELNIDSSERSLIFVEDITSITTQKNVLDKKVIYSICLPFIEGKKAPTVSLIQEDFSHYSRRVNSMTSGLEQPVWLREAPLVSLKNLMDSNTKAVLLFGPPRTGKTRCIDAIVARDSSERCNIQIHDGWGYDNLIEGFLPDEDGKWEWKSGPLKEAIESGKKYIILEEINRTTISQSLGEVFSLIEESYRGKKNAIILRSGSHFWIPEETVFLMTMNTIDKSTEEIDDALWGRIAAVEFPPRVEDLNDILIEKKIPQELKEKILQLYAEILERYPLGHGYFASIHNGMTEASLITYYMSRVRPVIQSYLGELRKNELAQIDSLVDAMFGAND